MRTSTLGLSLLCVAIAGRTSASFDLMLALDQHTKGVYRYDPITGASFGSFAVGWFTNPIDMAIDQNANEAYVLDNLPGGDRVFKIDYNTGEFKGHFDVGALSANRLAVGANGDILVAGVGGGVDDITRFSKAGAVIRTYNPNRAEPCVAVTEVSGMVVGFAGQAFLFSFNATTGVAGSGLPALYAIQTSNLAGFAGRAWWGYEGSGLANRRVTSSGLVFDDAGSLFAGIPYTGVAAGHNGMIFTSTDNGIATTFRRYLPGGQQLGSFDAPLQQVVAISNVVAPEPATFLALGAGLLAFRRRRK